MAESPYTGLTASISVGTTPLAYMNNFELNLDRNVIEILQFGSEYKNKALGMKNWSASVEGTVAFDKDGSQTSLVSAFENGTKVKLKTLLKTNVYFEGDAYIASLSISGTPDEALTISAEFEGDGAVTFTAPTA